MCVAGKGDILYYVVGNQSEGDLKGTCIHQCNNRGGFRI